MTPISLIRLNAIAAYASYSLRRILAQRFDKPMTASRV